MPIVTFKRNRSNSRFVPLRPKNPNPIVDEYIATEDVLRSQADSAIELAKRLLALLETIDKTSIDQAIKERLRKDVLDMGDIARRLLNRTSKFI